MRAPHNKPATSPDTSLAGVLLQLGYIGEDALDRARDLSRDRDLGALLLEMGMLSEEQLFQAYGQLTGLPMWDGSGEPVRASGLSDEFLAFNRVLPVRNGSGLVFVTDQADDDGLLDLLARIQPEAILALCPASELSHHLDTHFDVELGDVPEESEGSGMGGDLDIERLKDLALEAPIIRQVNDFIATAVRLDASDIHLEPFRSRVELRFRVDGVLMKRSPPRPDDYPAVVSRVKILAGLDIAERRLPQDGRIRTKSAGRDIDIRVSTVPTAFGEDVVLRLLDQNRRILRLEGSGLSPEILTPFRANLRRSHGIVLVTGPTGSGKTTTLYSALQELIDGERKIITCEDPVEYEIPGVTQIPVNEGIGMSFGAALRSILRHDPDVILIGEIRDRETAEIAIQSALTGHMVLSTLHTNSAVGAIARFLEMGMPDYLLASSLLAVSAQRLVRRLCPECKSPHPLEPDLAERFHLSATQTVYRPVGCNRCANTGYRGRLPIAEVREVDAAMRHAILTDPSLDNLGRIAADNRRDTGTLLDDGMRKVVQGETSVDEVFRVAG